MTPVVVYREVKIRDLPRILLQCGVTTSVVFMLIATSAAMSWVLASENVLQGISAGLLGLTDNGIVLLLLINAILLAVGTFIDMTPAVLIFTPILLPIVQRIGGQLWGVREDSGYALYFGIILIMNLCIGLCTPPVGTCLFLGCGIGGTTVRQGPAPSVPVSRRDGRGLADLHLPAPNRPLAPRPTWLYPIAGRQGLSW